MDDVKLRSFAMPVVALLAWSSVGLLAGESPDVIGPFGVLVAIFVAPVAVAIITFAIGRSMLCRKTGIALGVLCGLSFGTAAGVGSLLQSEAYNGCLSEGLVVQRRIERFADLRGSYPGSLSELSTPEAPCRIPLRGSLLRYESDGKTYRLWFTDSFVTHEATNERAGFVAAK